MGLHRGARPNLIAIGTEASDIMFSGFSEHLDVIAAGDFTELVPSIGPPATDADDGIFVFKLDGRTIAELSIVGTGSEDDGGRVQVFALNPNQPSTGFKYEETEREAFYAERNWTPRPLLDLTFSLGTVTGPAGGERGLDDNALYADTITIDSDHTWSANAAVLCDDTGHIARVRFDASGAVLLVVVVTRDNGTGSSASSGSGVAGGADSVGVTLQLA